jgi:hypothetical protein
MACIASIISKTENEETVPKNRNAIMEGMAPAPCALKMAGVIGIPGPVFKD